MMECQLEAAQPLYNPHCWRIDGLPDMLDQGDLDEFSNDHEDLGPRGPWIEQNHPNVNNKWKQRGPRNSRLIQLAFHDCLRYSNSTVFITCIIYYNVLSKVRDSQKQIVESSIAYKK